VYRILTDKSGKCRAFIAATPTDLVADVDQAL